MQWINYDVPTILSAPLRAGCLVHDGRSRAKFITAQALSKYK